MVLSENAAGFYKVSIIFCAEEYKVCVIKVYELCLFLNWQNLKVPVVPVTQPCRLYRQVNPVVVPVT